MSLLLDEVSVWLPRRGQVFGPATLALDGVVLLVGRNGAGTTTLLRAVAGALTPGARVTGAVELDGVPLAGFTHAELDGIIDSSHLDDLPEQSVAALVRGVDPGLVGDFGIDPSARSAQLPSDQRAALRLLRALGGPRRRVVLLDQPLTGLAPRMRETAQAAIRKLADDGVVVLWAEHLIEEALGVADHVVEVLRDQVMASTATAWSPRSIPAPPAMALARALDLPRGQWSTWSDGHLASAVGDMLPRHATRRRHDGDLIATAQPAQTGLGTPIELRGGECIGVVSTSGDRHRERDVARRLVAVARGETTLASELALPRAESVDRIVAAWERRHRVDRGTVVAHAEPLARLDPRRSPLEHSSGERTALAWGLALARSGPRLLVGPTDGLDPAGRRHAARCLYDEQLESTVVVSSDIEFMSRACHRFLVLDGEEVVADGTPLAVMEHVPQRPQLVRLGIRALRAGDVATMSRRREVGR